MLLSEMKKHYPEEKYCYDLLEELLWNDKPKCHMCDSTYVIFIMVNHHKSRDSYKCGGCGRMYSVTSNTIFHFTRLPLVKWFTAIHYIKTCRRKPYDISLVNLIGVDRTTASRMIKMIQADLEADRYDSLSHQIYEHNRQLERFWF